MAADFWAGYISGAVGILIGNPLDLIKVRLQATALPTGILPASPTATTRSTSSTPRARLANPFTTASSLIRGASAPILGYGALNALLFMTYNRSLSFLSHHTYLQQPTESLVPRNPSLSATFIAGALGGLATFVISTPTELIKCRAQVSPSSSPQSSYAICKDILRAEGIKGLYFGGVVTALRDSIGYGFYFWSYEIMTRWMREIQFGNSERAQEAAKVLLCGGVAGVVTWASVFPLDVVKTRVQTQALRLSSDVARSTITADSPLLEGGQDIPRRRIGAWEMAKGTYHAEGVSVFFRGLGVCSLRAFIVNAAQWAVYEWIMNELEPGRRKAQAIGNGH